MGNGNGNMGRQAAPADRDDQRGGTNWTNWMLAISVAFAVIWNGAYMGYRVFAAWASWLGNGANQFREDMIAAMVPPVPVPVKVTLRDQAEAAYLEYQWLFQFEYLGILLAVVFSYFYGIPLLRTTIWKMRGIKTNSYRGEAMRTGSVFSTADTPLGQIAIKEPGLLVSSHIGYGLRVGNVLVTPTHVLSDRATVMLEYRGAKILANVSGAIGSAILHDVAYVMLPTALWSQLGCRNVKTAETTSSLGQQVSCTGVRGRSVGTLLKSKHVGIHTYTGSTLPGMSGAAYAAADGTVLAMHTGTTGENNIGVSMVAMRKEVLQIFKGESSEDFMEDQMMYGKTHKSWNDASIDELIRQKQQANFHDDEEGAGYFTKMLKRRGAESAPLITVALTPEQKEAAYRKELTALQNKFGYVTIAQHSDGTETSVVEKQQLNSGIDFVVVMLSEKLQSLTQRMTDVESVTQQLLEAEGRVDKPTVEEPKKLVVSLAAEDLNSEKVSEPSLEIPKYQCGCGVICRNEQRFANHVSQCRSYVGESLNLAGKIVKQTKPDFLGRPNSAKRTKRTSTKSSNSSGGKRNFTALEAIPSQISELKDCIMMFLQNQQRIMDGQNSVMRPNSSR